MSATSRDGHPIDDSFGELDGRIGERDVAYALLGSTEDACFIFRGTADAPRLAATAARDPGMRALVSVGRAEVPDDVKDTIRTGIPRRLTWPAPDSSGAAGAHRSWRIAESLHPCHGLVVPLDTESGTVGAVALLRCGDHRTAYSDSDVDTFRLLGLRIAARLDTRSGTPSS